MNENCEAIQKLLPQYNDKQYDEKNTAMVNEHLIDCIECKAILKQLQDAAAINLLHIESEEIKRRRNQSIIKYFLFISITIVGLLAYTLLLLLILPKALIYLLIVLMRIGYIYYNTTY